MPLPTLAVPKYPITIPSTKKSTFFRPFLMKEQKILFMALESKETTQMLSAMSDIVKNCVDMPLTPETMPMFDIEYLFARIRAKSVGESVDVTATCPKCQSQEKLSIAIDTIEVEFPPDVTNKIMLTDKLGIILRYPCLMDAAKNITGMNPNEIFAFVSSSIDMIFDENTTYSTKDFTPDEVQTFVESMSTSQFEQITKFYDNLPQLNKKVSCTCKKCEHDYIIDFRGLQDFFT